MSGTLRLSTIFAVLAAALPAWSQSGMPDLWRYEKLFRQIERGKPAGDQILLNGQPSGLRLPSIQEILGLTDTEARNLDVVAGSFSTEIRDIDSAERRLVFEIRMRRIASSEAPGWLATRHEDVRNRRTSVIAEHVDRLRAFFGEARFLMLDGYLRLGDPAATWPAPVPVTK